MEEINSAIVLAAGRGRRMQSDIPKQYMDLCGKPVIYYSLKVFEDFEPVREVILVAGKEDLDYCRKEIVDRYHFTKVGKIIAGGKERYHSVYEGLREVSPDSSYVFIHDGARPCVDRSVLERYMQDVRKYQACVCGMPSKDTVRIADREGFAQAKPDRTSVWMMQTPQVFSYTLILKAYEKMLAGCTDGITDDAMAVERTMGRRIKLTEGSWRNIKITTPEDLELAALFVRNE